MEEKADPTEYSAKFLHAAARAGYSSPAIFSTASRSHTNSKQSVWAVAFLYGKATISRLQQFPLTCEHLKSHDLHDREINCARFSKTCVKSPRFSGSFQYEYAGRHLDIAEVWGNAAYILSKQAGLFVQGWDVSMMGSAIHDCSPLKSNVDTKSIKDGQVEEVTAVEHRFCSLLEFMFYWQDPNAFNKQMQGCRLQGVLQWAAESLKYGFVWGYQCTDSGSV